MKLNDNPNNTLEKIKVEIALMLIVSHDNIIKYYETFLYRDCLFMVIETENLPDILEELVLSLSDCIEIIN